MSGLRRDLCILDWNEHVDRQYTSVYRRIRPDRMGIKSGNKTYKKKPTTWSGTSLFIWNLWLVTTGMLCCTPSEDESDSDNDLSDDVLDQNTIENFFPWRSTCNGVESTILIL